MPSATARAPRPGACLTKLRGESERVAVRAASLGATRGRARRRGLEALRAELGPLTLDLGVPGGAPGERARKLEEELGEVDAGLRAPPRACSRARSAEATRVRPRGGARRGPRWRRAGPAPRAPGRGAARRAPPRGAAAAPGRPARSCLTTSRAARRRGRGGRRGDPRPGRADRVAPWSATRATATRSPTRCAPARSASSSCRPRSKSAADELTQAEVEAAHLGDRRAEAERELASIAERLGEEVRRRPSGR